MDAKNECSCWRAPTDSGQIQPLAWTCLHDAVRIITANGLVVEGYSNGPTWWGPPSDAQVLMEVETTDGDTPLFSMSDLSSVTPISGIDTTDELVQAIRDLLADPALTNGHARYLRLLVGQHETVDFEIRWHRHPCTPPDRPEWATAATTE